MNKNSGFTLIEVLIAVVLLAGGLLGLAALQAASLKNNQSAYNRSQATQMAYDMADRIRANPVESSDRANTNPSTLAASAYFATATPAPQASCDSSPGCTPALMAQNDRAKWLEIVNNLPSGMGTIAVDAATRVFTITISWRDDNRSDAVTSFTMSFQI